ncbi:hypothetical protein PSAC2689_60288 [Paraburkholderia sacchari]|uniref:FCD domain-containing protein n=1 Tax=Paraburkholderia sacchari TaxID=159450 RepID=UPI0039A68F84
MVADLTLKYHQKILEALEQHDPDAAERALRDHLDDAYARQQAAYDANVELFLGR